jgi:GTP-binding protein
VPVAEPVAEVEDEVADFAVFRPAKAREFEVSRGPDGAWVVRGEAVERLFARWDLENEEAQAHVERRLQRMGVIAALERAGFTPGDDVEIGGTVFELDPS